MKNYTLLIILSLFVMFNYSCKQDVPEAGFEDMIRQTILDYIDENDSLYSNFKKIIVAGELDMTLGAYNPNGNNYTMFLPTNEAVDDFIANSSRFNSLDDLLNDKEYVSAMARYHVVNMGLLTNDFPFGALPELNLSGQYLTIGIESVSDSSYYKVNNFAPVVEGNIEVSNGYVHIISKALSPLTYNTYQWLEQNPAYSIFYEAVKQTGFDQVLSRIIYRDSVGLNPVTLFVEPDTVYHRYNIFSFDDLVEFIDPYDNNYTDPINELNKFVGYHITEGSTFLSNYEGSTSNFNSFGPYPIEVNGMGEELLINSRKIIKDTTVVFSEVKNAYDTVFTYLEIMFLYDQSNILTLSGAVHSVNEVLTVQRAGARDVSFEFFEEPIFSSYREKSGEYLIEERELLSVISWTGGDDRLLFVKNDVESEQSWNKDYLQIDGDFSISYQLPRIVAGKYNLILRAHAYGSQNALVEVFFDGVKIGGLVDLKTIGNQNWPYSDINLGELTLLEYESHVITVRSLISGTFKWDVVRFEIPD
ncbi:MAG TPA: fasciclin domain-containing protein [Prolixibacteraceae bacterium]|nr:fasciclin domain-containing protein [Prolixibacteraceae bacterium]